MNYKVLASTWFTTGRGETVGAVAIETAMGDWKAYIGVGSGLDEKADEQYIAAYGSKLLPNSIAKACFPALDPERLVV